jgi:hypothetical protein
LGDVFYTRRIGDRTYKGAYVVDSLQSTGNEVLSAPSQAQLINAMKVSGRTKKGLGIGVFNAIEQRAEVRFRDSLGVERAALAHPFSNYNVLVFSQNLRNNGNLSLVNTQVFRPEVKALNNVTHTQLSLFSKDRMYNLVGMVMRPFYRLERYKEISRIILIIMNVLIATIRMNLVS